MATSYLDKLYESFGKLFVRTINGQKPDEAGNVEIVVTGGDSDGIPKIGDRGTLAGYNTPASTSSAVTIDASSNDDTVVTSAVTVTVSDGSANQTWTKTVSIQNASATIKLGESWVWTASTVPTVTANAILVLHWCNSVGVASLVTGAEIKHFATGTISVAKNYFDTANIFVIRDDVVIYTLEPESTTTVELAPGDQIIAEELDPYYLLATVSSSTGITFVEGEYYNPIVKEVQNGFTLSVDFER